jgi:putative membrane protein
MMDGTNGVTMTGAMGWWALPMMAAMLAGFALVAFGGIWVYRQLSDRSTHRSTMATTASTELDPAQQQLRARYAAGDIDDDEYERRLSALTHWR